MSWPRLLLLVLGLALVAGLWRGNLFFSRIDAQLALSTPYIVDIRPGSNLTRVLRQLEEEEILPDAGDVLLFARLYQGNVRIHAGEYELRPGLDVRGLLDLLRSGAVLYHQVTLIEGWTLRQALQALQAHPAVDSVLAAEDGAALQQAFGTSEYPEGRFFPDTYRFTRGTTDLQILQQAFALMDTVLAQAWARRSAGLPLQTPYEALVLASIVEKETGVLSEREQVAGVFIRRLVRNMRLQTDPTVIYGLGREFDGNLTRAHLRQDTPWNTYVHNGLPPTPIALPGRAAIEATLHPADGSALYFVARGDGSHYFSETLEEHNRAVRQYQLNQAAIPVPEGNE